MGKVDPARLRPELREALKGIRPGETTGVIKVAGGYAIVKVLLPSESHEIRNASPARNFPMAATGIIRYPPSVGGKNEADLAFRSFRSLRVGVRIWQGYARFAGNPCLR